MFNEKTCTRKWWNAEEPFVEKRLALFQQIKKEAEKDYARKHD